MSQTTLYDVDESTCPDYALQKLTTFLGAGAVRPTTRRAPVNAPNFTAEVCLRRSSARSSFATSAVLRLNVWKSSSSAPASVPVPKKMVVGADSTPDLISKGISCYGRRRTSFTKGAVLGKMSNFFAEFATSAVRINTPRGVLGTSRCQMASPRANKTRRER